MPEPKFKVGDKVTVSYQSQMKYVKILYVAKGYDGGFIYFGTYVTDNVKDEGRLFFDFNEERAELYSEKVNITISRETYDLLKSQLI